MHGQLNDPCLECIPSSFQERTDSSSLTKTPPCGQHVRFVVFPALHEGGQLASRLRGQGWIVNFTEQLAAATEPSIFSSATSSMKSLAIVLKETSDWKMTSVLCEITYACYGNYVYTYDDLGQAQ